MKKVRREKKWENLTNKKQATFQKIDVDEKGIEA